MQLHEFFGLYQALLTSIELRHAPFITYLPGTDLIWLAALSSKDPYYITPIIMGITMFLQQKMSPPATDPTQQKIMMFLPIVFTALFLSFPSGLVVYWLVNNILSTAQQWRVWAAEASCWPSRVSAHDRVSGLATRKRVHMWWQRGLPAAAPFGRVYGRIQRVSG